MISRMNLFRVLLSVFALIGAATVVEAGAMKITYYDDGLACPGDCDAHVVFNPIHNGTQNAFAPPISNREEPAKHRCEQGKSCVICFDESKDSCIEATYRGDGPPPGRFDVTPKFLEQFCSTASTPSAVLELCSSLKKAASVLLSKANCFKEPQKSDCSDVIKNASASQEADRPEYELCLKIGVKKYNAKQTDSNKYRSIKAGCGYAENLREKNPKTGVTWQRLMPGACRDGSYVGRWGTDCCTGFALTDASFGGGECDAFYR